MKVSKDVSEGLLDIQKTNDRIMVVTPHHQINYFLQYPTGPFADLRALIQRLQQTTHLPVIDKFPDVEATSQEIASTLYGPLDKPTQDCVGNILEGAGINNISALNSMLRMLIHSIS